MRQGLSSGSAVSFFATDHLGSTAATIWANGNVRSQLRYDPWGKERYAQHTTPTGYRYTSQRWDSGLGLYDYNARYYDPHIGRFISADSIVPNQKRLTPLSVAFHETAFLQNANGENHQQTFFGPVIGWSTSMKQAFGVPQGSFTPQALNRYTYVLNNSLRYTDPSGHQQISLPTVPIISPDTHDPEWYTFVWDTPEGLIQFRIHNSDPRFADLQQLIADLEQEIEDFQAALNSVEASNESSLAFWVSGVITTVIGLISFSLSAGAISATATVGISMAVALAVSFLAIVIGAMLMGIGAFYDSATSWHAKQSLAREMRDLNYVLYGKGNRPGLYQLIEDLSH